MDRSEYMKKYREAHKDKCKEYRRKWRQAHKDDIARKAKDALYTKTYREKQKIMKTYYSSEPTVPLQPLPSRIINIDALV